jgi:transcriptional regulator with XRE-family HTH domain
VDPISEALRRAFGEVFTTPLPKSPAAQIRALVKAEKGSTRAAAARLGVSQRTVERYLTGKAKHPRPALRDALAREVARAWQPRIRRQAATRGITVETRARFGFTAPAGTTDDPRLRRITQHLPAHHALRLADAYQQGATEQQLQQILAEGLGEMYFRDAGRRAAGLDVAITDIDYLEAEF